MYHSYRRNMIKPIKLLLQVILFQAIPSMVGALLGYHDFAIGKFIRTLIPANYYVILYITLYWISPYLNIVINMLDLKQLRHCFIVLFVIFSIWPTLVDVAGEINGTSIVGLSTVSMYGSQWGYSIVNFILLYILGAVLGRGEKPKEKWGKITLLLLCNTLVLTIWAFVNDKTGFINERSAWEYCNPFLIVEAILIFKVFRQMTIKSLVLKKLILLTAQNVFGVFLLHTHFFKFFPAEKLNITNGIVLWGKILGISVLMFVICSVITYTYVIVMGPIHKLLEKMMRKYELIVLPKSNK